MRNQLVAEILYNVADILEIKGEDFKPRAYRKAANTVETLSEDIEQVYKQGRLMELPGVGEHIAEKIAEIIETGKLKSYEKLKKSVPFDYEELMNVQGMGPKRIKYLYDKLKIKNIKDLEKASKQGKIRNLEGFGEKSEQNILESIEFAKIGRGRMLLGFALPTAEEIIKNIKMADKSAKVDYAGSLRRKKETIGDIDILVSCRNPKKLMEYFTSMKDVAKVLGKGDTKSTVLLKNGLQVDIRVVPDESYGSALQYFTGSKLHNIAVRSIAIKKGYKLSEYGLFSGKKRIAGKTEKEIYSKLGMSYIEPEIRENEGEIELAIKNKLPKLIPYNSIRGDLQMHTKFSDGSNTVEEMALEAKKLGYEYIAITDHTGNLKVAGAMSVKEIPKYMKEIEKAEKKTGLRILKGCEVNILTDGSLDMPDKVLKDFDIVLAGVHSGFKEDIKTMTNRIINAMENEHVDVIAHPTGRILQKREGYKVDLDKLFDFSKKTKTYLEIDAYPSRLDLDSVNTRRAIQSGCSLFIDTDAHSTEQLRYMNLGVATARRGWAESKDILNTLPWIRLKKRIK
ncbi:MAG: DNA polymerase/3'-5' exonuclease PolX [Candidatus Nanoarchaeia archaeon]|nr:DNA polymerase/3'-5' exonuclease PolX [Candidatus Nanoarchaeia archaeon]